ncbi:conserved hypothetical protein [Vibrio chagasii]|nr:conserved hypothetical protein [Vibrio chagasii]CAH6795936.1 conserved hypothetical protein [Vibrio chagasii]CAH7440737.1 conserved hypothetical protein [Vibrio chagasii]CAH7481883.1 conserved hypothetical protein [Vibrio chagasii]
MRRSAKQHGVVTLLITSVLLLGALVVTLGSYRSIFHQMKVAQNEVQVRKAHWLAEGGLECGFTYIVENDLTAIPGDLMDHCQQSKVLTLESENLTPNILVSSSESLSLKKEISFEDASGLGVMQSNSSLEFVSDHNIDINPDIAITAVDGINECVSVRFLDSVTYKQNGGGRLKTITPESPPFPTFESCQPTTNISSDATIDSVGALPSNSFQSDFKFDPDIDTFFNYFGVPKTSENIDQIKLGYHVVDLIDRTVSPPKHIDLVNGEYEGSKCSKAINDAFSSGENKVWVIGDCVVYSPAINVVESIPGVVTPRSLVIQDGIVANGNASVFDGSFYHLNDMSIFDNPNSPDVDTDLLSDLWAKVPDTIPITGLVQSNSVYIGFASFFPKGGMFFDSTGGLSTIQGSINLDYTDEYNPHSAPLKAKWQRGSWSDF